MASSSKNVFPTMRSSTSMNSRLFVVIALCAALVMCRRETTVTNAPPPQQSTTTTATAAATTAPAEDLAAKNVDLTIPLKPDVVSQCRVGTKLDASGLVAESKKQLKAGEPVYVSMWLAESPEGLA